MNYQDIQIDFAYEIQRIIDLSITTGYGGHPTAVLKAIVDEEKRNEFIQKIDENTPISIKGKNEQCLFTGFVSEISFEKEKGLYYLNLTAHGATAKLDVLKRSRTFFKKGITYQEIIDGVLKAYPGASLISHVDFSKQTDFPIIQYKETDWEFILRLASLFEANVRPIETSEVALMEVGYEKKNVLREEDIEDVEIERDYLQCEVNYYGKSEVFSVLDAPKGEVVELVTAEEGPDVLNYTTEAFTLKDYYPVGSLLRINGAELVVTYVEAYLEKGEVKFDYVVRLPEAIKAIYRDNTELPGANLTGTVKKRVGNNIAIALEIDEDDGIQDDHEDYLFTYAIESKDFYCMPVEGAKVHLYFPTGKEWEAIAVHSLRSTEGGAQREGNTSNPSNRSLSNDFGSIVNLTPDSITLSPDDNNAIKMKLGSDGNISIDGTDFYLVGKDISISDAATINISAGATLFATMMTGSDEEMVPVDDHYLAIQDVTQVYATNRIYHVTNGAPQAVTPTYDDSALLAEEAAQAEEHNNAVADQIIQRNKEARAKFGRGLLMAALGTALIVVTGGAAAVAVGAALCVFAAADMAEAVDSRDLAMKGDWSTPASNALKEIIPEPAYSLIENGLIIAGSIMFAGPAMAGKMLIGAGINTGVELAFDLIPDGKLDKSPMEYLNSFSTNLMVSALTGPISNMDGCSSQMGNFAKQFASGFASSTLSGIAQGEWSLSGMAENFVREGLSAGISTKIGFTMDGKNKWLVAGVDTLTDTAIDSASQLWDIHMGRQDSFDWKRCAQTAVSSAATNFIFACDPVNVARGNLLIAKYDLVFEGLYGEEKWFRKYDSVLDFNGAFGKGWVHTFESFVFIEDATLKLDKSDNSNKYRAVVMLPDTHKENFVFENGAWTPEVSGAPYNFSETENGGFLLEEWQEEKYRVYYYDHKGRLVGLKNGKGQEPTRIYYKENGVDIPSFIRSTIDYVEYPGGQKLEFTYKDGLVASVTDHVGRKIEYHYANGQLDHVNYPSGGCQEYGYDDAGHIAVLKGEDGRDFMTNEFDRKGRVVCQTYPDGAQCHIIYDDYERKTTFTYSDSGRQEINYYNEKEEVIRREFGDGIFETIDYDKYGNKIAETDRNGNTTYYVYDEKGHLAEKRKPAGLVTVFIYDEQGLLVEEKDNTGAQTLYSYDERGLLASTSVKTSENVYSTTYNTRDEYGRITVSKDAMGYETLYSYEEPINKPTEVILPEGYVIRYTYDKAGRKTSITNDYGTKQFKYSETNALTMEIDALGNVTRYYRDSVGNLVKLIRPNEYDEETDNGVGTYYEYDYLDREIKKINTFGNIKNKIINMDGMVLAENEFYVCKNNCEQYYTRYVYDNRLYLEKKIAPNGCTTAYLRDKNGNILKEILPISYEKNGMQGDGISYVYDCENRVVEIIEENGDIRKWFKYDMRGNVVEEGYGKTKYGTEYVYDLLGRMVEKWELVDAERELLYNVTLFAYDLNGNCINERHSLEKRTRREYPQTYNDIHRTFDSLNRQISVADTLGAYVDYKYDCLNRLTMERKKYDKDKFQIFFYEYDAMGQLIERKEVCNSNSIRTSELRRSVVSTKYFWDKSGNKVKTIYPNDGVIEKEYNTEEQVSRQIIRDSRVGIYHITDYQYDYAGRLIGSKIWTPNDENELLENIWIYDEVGRVIAYVDPEGCIQKYEYDHNGNMKRLVSPETVRSVTDSGKGYEFEYDAWGRIVKIIDAYGNLLENNVYDSQSNILSQSDCYGLRYSAIYDIAGRRRAVFNSNDLLGEKLQSVLYDGKGNIIEVKDGENNKTSFRLDLWGKINEILKSDGAKEVFTYDLGGNLISTCDGNGNEIQYHFNSRGLLEKIKNQMGKFAYYEYDGERNVEKQIDENGKVVIRKFGSFRYLMSEYADDGSFHEWKYDGLGRVIESKSNHVTYKFTYKKNGKIHKKYINGKLALEYDYARNGKVSSITDATGKTSHYEYDLNGRLEYVWDAFPDKSREELVSYSYDKIGRIEEIKFQNGISTFYKYDDMRNIKSIETMNNKGDCLMGQTFLYDLNGNRIQRERDNNSKIKYEYDSCLRLSSITEGEEFTKFKYDFAGNRIEKICKQGKNLVVEKNMFNSQNQLISSITKVEGKIHDENGSKYEYDLHGSLVRECHGAVTKEYKYNGFHNCISINVNGSLNEKPKTQENLYDAEGLRYGIIEEGKTTYFVTDGWKNIIESDENGINLRRLFYGAGMVASDDCGVYRYYHNNEREDVEIITDDSGNVVNRYYYDSFGGLQEENENVSNRYTYNGQVFDNIARQYYLRKRFYNPQIGRFTQEDEFRGDGLNLYAYCGNNPMMYIDPSGYAKKDNNITMTVSSGNTAYQNSHPVLGQTYNKIEVSGTIYSRGEVRTIDRTVYQMNNIDWDYVSPRTISAKNPNGLSNRELAQNGRVPYGTDDMWIELHHLTQHEPGTMIEINGSKHDKYSKQLHGMVEDGKSFRNDPDLAAQYEKFREEYWKERIREEDAAAEERSKCSA